MAVTFSKSFPPINESDIQALEEQLHARLPDSYRNFLLEHNGGEPSPHTFLVNEREGDDNLRFLFGIGNHEHYSLMNNIRWYSDRIPANFIPIGCDSFGNLICLSIKGEDTGKVYFWDQDWEIIEGIPDYSNVSLIGINFSEFIDRLHDLSA